MVEKYEIDGITYSIPSEDSIRELKGYTEVFFDDPESILENYIFYYLMYGDKVVNPAIELLRTLSDPDMPPNYIEDLIKEFWERIEIKLFTIKNRRFKLIKRNDTVAKEFGRELKIRNESYSIVENVLINLGYKDKEVTSALREAINSVSDLNDAQQILTKALTILIAMSDNK